MPYYLKPNEHPVASLYGHWVYAFKDETGWEGYIHVECEAVADEHGYCARCGAPSPDAKPAPNVCPLCGENPCTCFTNGARLRRGEA